VAIVKTAEYTGKFTPISLTPSFKGGSLPVGSMEGQMENGKRVKILCCD